MAVEKFTDSDGITYTFAADEVQRGINAELLKPPPGQYATTGAIIFTDKQFEKDYDERIRAAGLPLTEVSQG